VEDEARGFHNLPFFVVDLILKADCKLIFLPPYSPDYNPIEQAFSSIKAWIRRNHLGQGIFGIVRALANVTHSKAAGWFGASGYL
jgi:hypothetical protein